MTLQPNQMTFWNKHANAHGARLNAQQFQADDR
jgi:hypothetical protein